MLLEQVCCFKASFLPGGLSRILDSVGLKLRRMVKIVSTLLPPAGIFGTGETAAAVQPTSSAVFDAPFLTIGRCCPRLEYGEMFVLFFLRFSPKYDEQVATLGDEEAATWIRRQGVGVTHPLGEQVPRLPAEGKKT